MGTGCRWAAEEGLLGRSLLLPATTRRTARRGLGATAALGPRGRRRPPNRTGRPGALRAGVGAPNVGSGVMRPSEIGKRLTGFSTPFGGVSWTAPEAEVLVARRVIRFLEDRRVLYNPFELEDPRHCVESIVAIRQFLTEELGHLPDDDLSAQLGALRAACRKFLDSLRRPDGQPLHLPHGMFHGGFEEWVFVTALGELRGVAGVLVAEIAAKYHLDVEDGLASILPADPADDGSDGVDSAGPRGAS